MMGASRARAFVDYPLGRIPLKGYSEITYFKVTLKSLSVVKPANILVCFTLLLILGIYVFKF